MLILYMLHVFSGDEWQGSSSHIIMYNTIAGSQCIPPFNFLVSDGGAYIMRVSDLRSFYAMVSGKDAKSK